MSKELVKKALELCDEDREIMSKTKIQFKKSLKKNHSKPEEIFNKKGKKAKTLIETYLEKKEKNNLKANLNYLKKMSQVSVKYNSVKSALSQNKAMQKHENAKTSKQAMEDLQESVFTEEDFKDFEKTYFNK